jgi:hypothetical protein
VFLRCKYNAIILFTSLYFTQYNAVRLGTHKIVLTPACFFCLLEGAGVCAPKIAVRCGVRYSDNFFSLRDGCEVEPGAAGIEWHQCGLALARCADVLFDVVCCAVEVCVLCAWLFLVLVQPHQSSCVVNVFRYKHLAVYMLCFRAETHAVRVSNYAPFEKG